MSRNSDSLLRKEVECNLGFAARNEVRQRLRRTARQGPAERAVTGIEKQLAQPRAADDRHVVRRRGPQARPPLHYRYSAETGKQLPDPPHDRIATDRVDGSVVASELRRPRGAQAVAEARDHDLVRLVGQADLGRRHRLRRTERQGNRVALERIDRDFQSQASQQQWAVTSQGDHISIGEEALAALQPDRVGLTLHRLDYRAIAECDAELRTAPGELLRKAMRIAGFILRRVDAAGDALLGMPRRRLDLQAFGGRLDLPLDAERAHRLGVPRQNLEIARAGGELQA